MIKIYIVNLEWQSGFVQFLLTISNCFFLVTASIENYMGVFLYKTISKDFAWIVTIQEETGSGRHQESFFNNII